MTSHLGAEIVGSAQTPSVLWVSTSLATRGGVASFVRTMRETDLWTDWRVRHVATHCDGSIARRVFAFLAAWPLLLHETARRPAIVHVHMSSYGSFFRKSMVVWLCHLSRLPVVLHVHGGEFHKFYAAAPRPLRSYIRATVETATIVVALGTAWQRRLQTVAPKAEVVVVPNAVRPKLMVAQPPRGEPVQMLYLGRVSDSKGTFDLLDAWAGAFSDGTLARLTIAGDGELERARQQIADLGMEGSVELLGWVPSQDVQGLLERSQVLVLPSHNEGQPMAVLEAMAHGLCVVATDTGGIPDLINEQCGILVPVGDSAALAAALTQVVTAPTKRTLLGSNGLQRVRDEFDVRVVSRRLDDIYRSVLQ